MSIMKRTAVLVPLFLFAILVLPPLVKAQDDEYFDDGYDIIEEIEQAEDDKYVSPTFQNLSKMYWAIGKLDIDDPKMIDYYLMINECPMYMQYYYNDFEWNGLQKATKDYILQSMGGFPTHFEFMSSIALGRYNVEKEEFEVADQDKIEGLRQIDVAVNETGYIETCGRAGEIYEYPQNIIVILNRPLVMETIPVEKELARLYIEEARRFYDNLPPEYRMKRYERIAYLRLKVRITQYKNTMKVAGGGLRAVVFGRLEGYEVYADYDKTKPLFKRNISEKRFMRLRRGSKGEKDAETGEDDAAEEQ
ncbi:MAG: DUF4852 domain-containing protein [Rhodospirillales bacterium]|nr:DUF4852 domain-containing protein [Rhodospirillales bacterium]